MKLSVKSALILLKAAVNGKPLATAKEVILANRSGPDHGLRGAIAGPGGKGPGRLLFHPYFQVDEIFFWAPTCIQLNLFEKAEIPKALPAASQFAAVEEVTLIEADFAADNFIARDLVTDDQDAADTHLWPPIDPHVDIDQPLLLVDVRSAARHRQKHTHARYSDR